MKLTPSTAIAALVVIGAGGFMAGRVSSPDTAASESRDGPAETRPSRATTPGSAGSSSAARQRTARESKSDRPGSTADRSSRLEMILRGENALERNRALLAFLDQLGPGDFEDAVAHFRGLGITEARMGEYSLLLTAWAEADPVSALAYAKENTGGGFARDTVLTSWATRDPEAAVRWASANHEGDEANPYMPGIIRGIAQSDPARATELLVGMPRSGERGRGLDFMLPHLLEKGTDAARDWVSAITDDSLRNGAMIRLAEPLAAKDPEGTAAWLLANPGEATERRMDDVYSAWARNDTQAAWSSFATLPAGGVRSDALRGVVSSVAREDPKTAISLMDRYPNDVTDRVVQHFVWHSFGSDPAAAAGQIARIADEGQRERTYSRTLDAWIERDPAAANAWLLTNDVPQPVRDRIARRQAGQQ